MCLSSYSLRRRVQIIGRLANQKAKKWQDGQNLTAVLLGWLLTAHVG